MKGPEAYCTLWCAFFVETLTDPTAPGEMPSLWNLGLKTAPCDVLSLWKPELTTDLPETFRVICHLDGNFAWKNSWLKNSDREKVHPSAHF